MSAAPDRPAGPLAPPAPLIAHIVYRLDVGGLENGLINLINQMPAARYRNAIICLTDCTDFSARLQCPDVPIVCLHKCEGKDPAHYLRLWQALRRLRPAIVHTRGLGTIDAQLLAAMAGVRGRVHGEHGREMGDLDGSRLRYRLLRCLLRPVIGQFIAVSGDLAQWLGTTIAVPPSKLRHLRNGVDCSRFSPAPGPCRLPAPPGFLRGDSLVIGSVGRMVPVKDYHSLVQAFVRLVQGERSCPTVEQETRLRLVIIGDGPDRAACVAQLQQAGMAHLAWLPGSRDDVAALLRCFDLFVLPSLAEGSSNTVLEAMASGLPVVASAVGGNLEIVHDGVNGTLTPPRAPAQLAAAIDTYLRDPGMRARHGRAARHYVSTHHSLDAMVAGYLAVYDHLALSLPLKG